MVYGFDAMLPVEVNTSTWRMMRKTIKLVFKPILNYMKRFDKLLEFKSTHLSKRQSDI